MQKTSIKGQDRFKRILKWIFNFFKRRYRGILYYGAITAVLILLASAAESYRTDKENTRPLVLTDNMVQDVISDMRERSIYPDGMGLIRGFSSLMEWNKDLGQWESHCANDYTFENDQVICLSGGSVTAAGESGARGGFIEISGNDGYVYIYSSVIPAEHIAAGTELSAGEIIAKADNAIPSEFSYGNHVHLEVYKNGVPADYEIIGGKSGETMD